MKGGQPTPGGTWVPEASQAVGSYRCVSLLWVFCLGSGVRGPEGGRGNEEPFQKQQK